MRLKPSDTYTESQMHQVMLDRLEVTVRNQMAREINRYIRAYAETYGDSVQEAFIALEHERRITSILEANIKKTAPAFGKLVRRQIDTAVKETDPTFYQRIADRWILSRGLDEAKGIATTTTEAIRKAITLTVVETVSVAAIAKAIRGVTKFTGYRAAMIARTETHNAANFATMESAKEASTDLGIQLQKFWVPVSDARTRDNHASMASHEGIDLDQRFNVGGAMMERPGDPAGGASNVINCRCTLVMRRKQIEID